jgi:hypothetical protein
MVKIFQNHLLPFLSVTEFFVATFQVNLICVSDATERSRAWARFTSKPPITEIGAGHWHAIGSPPFS